MIKCEKGVFEAQGSNAALKAELAIIIENLKKCFAEKMGQEEAGKEVREAIRIGFMTEEEFEKELEKKIKKSRTGNSGRNQKNHWRYYRTYTERKQ